MSEKVLDFMKLQHTFLFSNMILHIPHSSTVLPTKEGFVNNENTVRHEINILTDWYTDELFYSPDCTIVKADFSRIFCDVERFADDSKEIMSKYGMGVCYTKTDSGEELRSVSNIIKEKIINKYYWEHHNRLEHAVGEELKKCKASLILDCHSFPDAPFQRDSNKQLPRPEINIGFDSFHTPTWLIDKSLEYFQNKGFNVWLNQPYSGTIVPMKYYYIDNRVKSIMLEVNRKLYLDDRLGKTNGFFVLQKIIENYIYLVKDSLR